MLIRVGALAAICFLAVAISAPANAQTSTVTILAETLGDGVVPPVPVTPLSISDTEYPLAALKEAQEGSVTLNLIVDAQGRVTFAQRLTSSGSGVLDQTAVQIARTAWTFQPARNNGGAVVGSVKVEVNWKLPLRPADELNAQMLGAPITGRKITIPSLSWKMVLLATYAS